MAEAAQTTRRWMMVRRGERVGSSRPDYVWWQEIPEGTTPEEVRSLGYEVVEMAPASSVDDPDVERTLEGAGEQLAVAARNLLAILSAGDPDHEVWSTPLALGLGAWNAARNSLYPSSEEHE